MANIIEAWRRRMDVPEKMEQSARTGKKTAGTGRILNSVRKTSAERAVERLVEKGENAIANVQSSIANSTSEQESNLLKNIAEKEKNTEQQVMEQKKAENKKEDKIQRVQNVKEELKQLNEINGLLSKLISAQEAAAEEEEIRPLTADEVKKIVQKTIIEEKDTEEIKEFLSQKFVSIEDQIRVVQNIREDETIIMSLQEIKTRMEQLSVDMQKLGGIKIMLGVSIWCSLLTFAVLVAYILHFI